MGQIATQIPGANPRESFLHYLQGRTFGAPGRPVQGRDPRRMRGACTERANEKGSAAPLRGEQ